MIKLAHLNVGFSSNSSVISNNSESTFAIEDHARSKNKRNLPPVGKKSKLLEKYKGMKSEEQLAHENAIRRMTEGMQTLLKLHKPVELSAICGVLGLKTLEKSDTSIDQIINYAKANNEVTETKLVHILNAMWEGALFEYLRILGYPMQTQLLDPRAAIIRIWREGGFSNASAIFTPFYMERLIQHRYEDLRSQDILTRVEQLRVLEERTKIAETDVIEEHDYRKILKYFQQSNELRKNEHLVRDYLINELEMARARLGHLTEGSNMTNQCLLELEQRYLYVSTNLTEQLARQEIITEAAMKEKIRNQKVLLDLSNIIHTFFIAREQLFHRLSVQREQEQLLLQQSIQQQQQQQQLLLQQQKQQQGIRSNRGHTNTAANNSSNHGMGNGGGNASRSGVNSVGGRGPIGQETFQGPAPPSSSSSVSSLNSVNTISQKNTSNTNTPYLNANHSSLSSTASNITHSVVAAGSAHGINTNIRPNLALPVDSMSPTATSTMTQYFHPELSDASMWHSFCTYVVNFIPMESKTIELSTTDLFNDQIKALYFNLLKYKTNMNHELDCLREIARWKEKRILDLELQVESLQKDLNLEKTRSKFFQESLKKAWEEIHECAVQQVEMNVARQCSASLSWNTALRWATRAQDMENRLKVLRPFVLEGLRSRNLEIVKLSQLFNDAFNLFTRDEMTMYLESVRMKREDDVSFAVRKAMLDAANKPKKKKKAVKGKAGKASSSKATGKVAKKKAPAGASAKKVAVKKPPPKKGASSAVISRQNSPQVKKTAPGKIVGSKSPPKKRK